MMISNTRDLLLSHNLQSEEEASHQRKMLSLLAHQAIWSSTNFSPGHFTASAMVLSPDQRKALLIYHSGFQFWIQPGGHIDTGDATLLKTALREVEEECGLSETQLVLSEENPALCLTHSLLQLDIHAVPESKRKKQPAHFHYDLRFVFISKTWKAAAGSDAKSVAWVSFEDFEIEKSDASVAESMRRLKRLCL